MTRWVLTLVPSEGGAPLAAARPGLAPSRLGFPWVLPSLAYSASLVEEWVVVIHQKHLFLTFHPPENGILPPLTREQRFLLWTLRPCEP